MVVCIGSCAIGRANGVGEVRVGGRMHMVRDMCVCVFKGGLCK